MKGRLVALSLLCALLLGGCWDRIELEDQLYVVTAALDTGRTERYRVTVRTAVFAAQKAGVLGGREGGVPGSDFMSAEADSLAQAMYVLNSSTSRRLSTRHIRSIVVGEELARQGLRELWSELTRSPEFRATAGFHVARGRAEEVLRAAKWPGEYNPARVTEGILLVQKQLHMAPPIRIHHMVNRTGVLGIQPFAPVFAINPRVTGEGDETAATESAVAGEQRRMSGNPVEIAGTALFLDTKLVGYLTVDETQALLALRGEMGKAYVTIPSPFDPDDSIMMRFQQENLPKYEPTLTPQGPRVHVRLIFEGEVLTAHHNYRHERIRTAVEEAARVHMEKQLRSALAKMKEWKTDPVGFGLLFRGKFARWEDWNRYKWNDHLEELEVKVSAKMRIRRHGLMLGGESQLRE